LYSYQSDNLIIAKIHYHCRRNKTFLLHPDFIWNSIPGSSQNPLYRNPELNPFVTSSCLWAQPVTRVMCCSYSCSSCW